MLSFELILKCRFLVKDSETSTEGGAVAAAVSHGGRDQHAGNVTIVGLVGRPDHFFERGGQRGARAARPIG